MILFKRKNTIRILMLAGIMMMATLNAMSQDKPRKQKSPEKQHKEFLKLQDSRAEQSEASIEKGREEHVKRQSKETQKRMKKNEKRTRRIQEGKHPKSFFERLFAKKPPKR